MDFLLLAGTEHHLADAEILAVIPTAKKIADGAYLLRASFLKRAKSLGSVIKLAKIVGSKPSITHPNFSIISVPFDHSSSLLLSKQTKRKLNNKKLRFVVAKQQSGISPLELQKDQFDEFFLYKDRYYQTIWWHDTNRWIQKDRSVPVADARIGLLPPKLARIMINLASTPTSGRVLLDPFCGFGRIMAEALEMGYKVIGSDQSSSQINGTASNLTFLGFDPNLYRLIQADATSLANVFDPDSIDLIVTEPFLGRPNIRSDRVDDVISGLKKLYLGSLKSWAKILRNNAKVVMVLPIYTISGREIRTSDILSHPSLDTYQKTNQPDLFYSRPESRIVREIVVLRFVKKVV